MKNREIIDLIDEIKPNSYSDEVKLRWIAELDGKIAANLMQAAPVEIRQLYEYPYPEALETEPLVSFPHDDIYTAWLSAKIDFADGEWSKYNGDITMYQAIYDDFSVWFLQNYDPAQYER